MSWLESLVSKFKKPKDTEKTAVPTGRPGARPSKPPPAPEPPQDMPKLPDEKGVMSFFYRKWKDPAFLKQVKILTAHMAKDGVDIKDQAQVKAWLEKNKEAVEAGKFNDSPAEGAKVGTFEKTGPDIGRNDPCPCGSGKKYKKCCALKKS